MTDHVHEVGPCETSNKWGPCRLHDGHEGEHLLFSDADFADPEPERPPIQNAERTPPKEPLEAPTGPVLLPAGPQPGEEEPEAEKKTAKKAAAGKRR